MARPTAYTRIARILESGKECETVVLGQQQMWGIKHGEYWVTLCKEDTYGLKNWKGNGLKYTRLFYSTLQVAQTQADKLNRLFNTDEYIVAEIQ